jgi:hypothetical protein
MITLMPFRKRYWGYGTAALLLAGAGTAGFLRLSDRTGPPTAPAAASGAVQTAEVVRMDISSGKPLQGTIGYGTARSLKAPGEGVVTWLPTADSTIKRGRQVYRVDDRPVPLFYGKVPLYRTLDHLAMVGRDVRVVADNLRAFGYSIGSQPRPGSVVAQSAGPGVSAAPRTVHSGEAVVTERLIKAIKAWQHDLQLPETGHVGRGDVVVQAAAIRVASLTAQVGDVTGGELMTVTATTKVISVPAEVGDAGSVQRGDTVNVGLPDGTRKPAEVVSVGTAVATGTGAPDPQDRPKLMITLRLATAADAAKIDAADVQVDFVTELHRHILAVPVGALLALSEGGYAVQVSGGGLVPVQTGIIAKGMAEVKGSGLAEGALVVTTS